MAADAAQAAVAVANWAKRYASQFAMHFTLQQLERIFAQIDRLHDVDEWLDGDLPMRRESFVSFLRAMLLFKPQRWPGLGMTQDGYLLANWGSARDAITLEFLADDNVRWSLSYNPAGAETERAAGTCLSRNVRHRINGFDPDHWFNAR